MKKTVLIILAFVLSMSIMGQELMKIGEVFNFEIGDEFQTIGEAEDQTPNADRITIIGKYYSVEQDTVFYIRYHNSYYTVVIWDKEPYLDYNFGTKIDTIHYSSLDSSMSYFDQGFNINQYIDYSTELCDILVNRCEYASDSNFESDYIINEYGKGLGKTYYSMFSGTGNVDIYKRRLFYYKKGGNECGIPDTITVNINNEYHKKYEFSIFPNPANTVINIYSELKFQHFQIKIFNSSGQLLMSKQLSDIISKVEISHLKQGLYLLMINYENKAEIKKIIKE